MPALPIHKAFIVRPLLLITRLYKDCSNCVGKPAKEKKDSDGKEGGTSKRKDKEKVIEETEEEDMQED